MQDDQSQGIWHRLSAGERNYIIPATALVFALGVWLALGAQPGLWPLWFIPVAIGIGLLLHKLRLPLRYACLPVVLMLALLWTQANMHLPEPAFGRYNSISAVQYGDAKSRSGGRIALVVTDVVLDGVHQPGMAYLTLREDSGVTADMLFDGAQLAFEGSVYEPFGKANEHDFDFRLWLLQQRIAYGIASVKNLSVLNTAETAPWMSLPSRVRGYCNAVFSRWMGEEASLAMGMLLGDQSAMQEDDQQAFRQAGVAHLMSVSGLHVSLLAALLGWVLNLLRVGKRMRLAVMVLFLLLYCAISGMSAAALRAAVMGILVLTAQTLGRKPDPLYTLSTAALIVLIIQPLQLFSAGFVLSFTAMGGILFLYRPIAKKLCGLLPVPGQRQTKWKRRLYTQSRKALELLAVSIAAQIGVLLPSAAYFHVLPLYGLLFNMITVPLSGLLVPLYAILLLFSQLPFVGDMFGIVLGFAAQWGSKLLLALVQLSDQLPWAQIRVAAPGIWLCFGLAFAVLTFSRYVRAGLAKRVIVLAITAVICVAGSYLTRLPTLRYHQMAVGQGDASLLIDGKNTIAIDVGEYGSEVTNRLLAEGRDVDALVLTHLHSDHAQGITAMLDAGIQIKQAYLPSSTPYVALGADSLAILDTLQDSQIPITYLSRDDMLTFDSVSIQVLWPEAGRTRPGMDANDRSLAMLIRFGDIRILNMADHSDLYEKYIAAPCDILKVAHHGSARGSTDDFLSTARPQLALVTCTSGANLPSLDTLERISNSGARILRTDETGEIIITPVAQGYQTNLYRSGATN